MKEMLLRLFKEESDKRKEVLVKADKDIDKTIDELLGKNEALLKEGMIVNE